MDPTVGNLNAINLMNWAIIPIMAILVVWRFMVRPRIVVRHVRQRYSALPSSSSLRISDYGWPNLR